MRNTKEKNRFGRLAGRVLVTLIGVALILVALCRLALFVFGTTSPASVHTRRYGGTNGSPPGQRYSWYIDYTFADKDGRTHSGNTTRRGSDIGVKTEHRVYYFASAPWLNALEGDAEPGLTQLFCVGGGALLLYAANRKHRTRRGHVTDRPDDA